MEVRAVAATAGSSGARFAAHAALVVASLLSVAPLAAPFAAPCQEAAPPEPAGVEQQAPVEPVEPVAPSEKEERRRKRSAAKAAEKAAETRRHHQLLAIGCAALALSSFSLGLRLLREKRPVVVPHRTIVPIVAAVALLELDHWFGGRLRFDNPWVGLSMLLAILLLAATKLRDAGRRLVVGGIGLGDAFELARAALVAAREASGDAAPEAALVIDEKGHTLQLGKEGPKLTVKEIGALGVVSFALDDKAPTALRQLVWSGLATGFEQGLIEVGVRHAARCFVAAVLLAAIAAVFATAFRS